jgi:DNA modification methylase
VELPYRLIQLYTFEGEVVLDPFMGSGQTAIAAIRTKRHFVGYDISQEYVQLAERRIVTVQPHPSPSGFAAAAVGGGGGVRKPE